VLFKLIVGLVALVLGTVGYVSTQHSDSPPSTATPVAVQAPSVNVASGEQRLEMTEQTLTEPQSTPGWPHTG
jgi:hypothetical protein